MRTGVARRQRAQNNEVASNSLKESVTNASVSGGPAFLKPERQVETRSLCGAAARLPRRLGGLTALGKRDYGRHGSCASYGG